MFHILRFFSLKKGFKRIEIIYRFFLFVISIFNVNLEKIFYMCIKINL